MLNVKRYFVIKIVQKVLTIDIFLLKVYNKLSDNSKTISTVYLLNFVMLASSLSSFLLLTK